MACLPASCLLSVCGGWCVRQAPDGTAYLGRTYYQDVEYVLPDRVMQPIWEGVRNADGSINFPLNYHRAYYDADYDDYNDIFQQRWRKEDISWKVRGHRPLPALSWRGSSATCTASLADVQVRGGGAAVWLAGWLAEAVLWCAGRWCVSTE